MPDGQTLSGLLLQTISDTLDSIDTAIPGISGGTQYATNVAYADANLGTLALVIRDDSLSTLTEADGDFSALRVSSTGALHVTGGGGGTEYTEDEVTANPQVGTATMMERDDALGGVTPAEGDWIGLRGTAEGALWVQDFNSDAILADTALMVTALQLIDDAVYVDDADWSATSSKHILIGGVFSDADRTVTDGDTAPLSIDVNGHLITSPHAEAVALGDNVSNTMNLFVDEDGDYVGSASINYYFDGSTWDRMRGDSTDGLLVNLGTNNDVTVAAHHVTNAGTFAVQVDGAALTALQLIDNIVLAEDAIHASGAPGVMALVVRNDSLAALAGDDGDYSPLQVDANGALYVTGGGGGTEYTEDAVSANPIVGTATMMERDDVLTTAVAEADWLAMKSTAEGALWVQDFNSDAALVLLGTIDSDTNDIKTAIEGTLTVAAHHVTNAGTFAVQVDGSALTALQLIDDAIYADDDPFTLATSKVIAVGAIRDDSLSTLDAAEDDAVPLRVSATGALHVTGGGGGTEYTEDAVSANPIVGSAVMMERDDVLTTAVAEADWLAMKSSAEGALWVQDFNSDAALAHLATIAGDTTSLDGKDFATQTTLGSVLTDTNAMVVDLAALEIDLAAIEVLLTAIDSDTNDIKTAVEGTLTVAAHHVTNAGTFAVQVDGAALTALQLIDNIVQAEDAEHASGAAGVMTLAVRNDALAALGGTDGDYAPLQVDANGSLFVTGGGGGTEYTEDAVSANPIIGSAVMMERDDVLTTAVAEADWLAMKSSAEGALWVQDFNSDAALAHLATIAGDTTSLDGKDFATQTTLNSMLTDTNAMVVDLAALEVLLAGIDSDTNTIQSDTTAILSDTTAILADTANMDTNIAAILADTANMDTNIIAILADTAAMDTNLAIVGGWDNAASDGASVSGDTAHDAVDAGEPVKVGYKAIDVSATPSDVAAGDRTDGYAMRNGIPFVLAGHPDTVTKSLQVTDADGAQTDTALVTVSAGTSIVVTKISVMADNANTVDVSVRIGYGTANTPAVDAAQVILFHPGIAAGSGVVEGTGAGIIGVGATNEDLRVTCEDPVTGSINIIVTYFTVSI